MYYQESIIENYGLLVLLNALLPVCMKYTARGESRVANIVGEAKPSAIFVTRPTPSCRAVCFIQKTKWQCFKLFIVFYTTDV